MDDETEGEQHSGDGTGECCDQWLFGTGGEQLRHLPEKPEGGPLHVQHDGRHEQGEFRSVHGVSLPLQRLTLKVKGLGKRWIYLYLSFIVISSGELFE